MSAIKDVQRSLNLIRQLSTDENTAVQQQILELMLQASISQLKSIGVETHSKVTAPSKPAPLPIPKPAKPAAPSPKTKPKPQPSLNTRLNRLRAVKPQAPTS